MKKKVFLIPSFIVILLSSCIFFQNINQPTKSLTNDLVTIPLHIKTDGGGESPYFGVCLPIGWTLPGDSIQCSGVYNELVYYDDSLSIEQNGISPAPTGYYWWVGKGTAVSIVSGNVYAVLSIQTDNQIGLFSIDYMLGESYNGVNQQRSDGHQIEIIDDEYSPRRLQVSVEGNSVFLNWSEPLNTLGLIGYNIYRDEVQINTGIIADTIFYDANPIEGIHSYTIASYYNNGNEYMIPYDKSVVYQSIYISPNGSNVNNGSSFSDALQTISYAMSVVRADSLRPITIYLAPGFYSSYTNQEQYPITCLNYVSLIGSGKDVTVLNADGQNTVLQFVNVEDIEIDGLSISSGNLGIYCSSSRVSFKSVNISSNNGEGIQFNSSSPYLENVTVSYNDGSGISCINSVSDLNNVTILENNGIGITTNDSSLNLENVTIVNNRGGIKSNNSALDLINVNIKDNTSDFGGGLYCISSEAYLLNVHLINNTSENSGGGIYCSDSHLDLMNVNIIGNTAIANGGGISADSSMVDLSNALVMNNIAMNNGGGIECLRNSVLNFDSLNFCDVYFNQAANGNDIYSDTVQNVIVDKFTVLNPTSVHAFPIENFTFNILQGMIIQAANDLFVSPEGDNTNSGLTINDPLKTIDFAILKILASVNDPHTIHLLNGTYSPSNNGEFFPVDIPEYLSLIGESLSNVILDAEGRSTALRLYNYSGMVISKVSDLTITGCNTAGILCENTNAIIEDINVTGNVGQGIICNNSNPKLENIEIFNNNGDGVVCSNNSNPTFENIEIFDNDGNGIVCSDNSNPELWNIKLKNNNNGIYCTDNSNPILDSVTISENSDGIRCNNSSPVINNVIIANNSSSGIVCDNNSNPTIENATITNNNGHGIYCGYYSSPTLTNVLITNNSTGSSGGGINCHRYSSPYILNSIISNNSSERFGGGINCDRNSSPTLRNVLITYNNAYRGGGVSCNDYSNPSFINVTIANNTDSISRIGGIDCRYDSHPVLLNSILSNNGPIEIFSGYSPETDSITISYSNINGAIEPSWGGYVNWLEGNIREDPLFVGSGLYPYALSFGSPSIDGGNAEYIYNDPMDPNNPGGALWPAMGSLRNDMGAYGGPYAASWEIVTSIEIDEDEEILLPTAFELAQNYPNPFNPSTTIQYSIKERSTVELVLYDILGRQVKVLVNEEQDAGYYKIQFNAGILASGVYLYRIQAGDFIETKKMVLLK